MKWPRSRQVFRVGSPQSSGAHTALLGEIFVFSDALLTCWELLTTTRSALQPTGRREKPEVPYITSHNPRSSLQSQRHSWQQRTPGRVVSGWGALWPVNTGLTVRYRKKNGLRGNFSSLCFSVPPWQPKYLCVLFFPHTEHIPSILRHQSLIQLMLAV